MHRYGYFVLRSQEQPLVIPVTLLQQLLEARELTQFAELISLVALPPKVKPNYKYLRSKHWTRPLIYVTSISWRLTLGS